ncbi:hypothetical protein CON47_20815 [Bacillus thuringiensis]|nr:hypothetical protein CON47_20815 [Bacillus thuringiensis]PGL46599.1 hypothetical protein CN914_23740 [Bacillus thuringiensis]
MHKRLRSINKIQVLFKDKKILPKRNTTYIGLFNMYLVKTHFLSIQLCSQYKWKLSMIGVRGSRT